jgi:hypothetical protein
VQDVSLPLGQRLESWRAVRNNELCAEIGLDVASASRYEPDRSSEGGEPKISNGMMKRQLQPTRSAQRPQTPFGLRALDGVAAEHDRALVRARGARCIARAVEQLRVGRVQRLVVLER